MQFVQKKCLDLNNINFLLYIILYLWTRTFYSAIN